MTPPSAQVASVARRVDELDWNHTVGVLDEVGVAGIGTILTWTSAGA